MSPSLISLGFVDWIMKTMISHVYEWGFSLSRLWWDAYTIFVSHTLADCDTSFLIGVLQYHDLGQLDAETVYLKISCLPSPELVGGTYRSATKLASSG